MLLCCLANAANIYYKPFESQGLARLESLSLVNSFITFFCGQFLFLELPHTQKVIVSMVAIFSNLFFMTVFVVAIVLSFTARHAKKLIKLQKDHKNKEHNKEEEPGHKGMQEGGGVRYTALPSNLMMEGEEEDISSDGGGRLTTVITEQVARVQVPSRSRSTMYLDGLDIESAPSLAQGLSGAPELERLFPGGRAGAGTREGGGGGSGGGQPSELQQEQLPSYEALLASLKLDGDGEDDDKILSASNSNTSNNDSNSPGVLDKRMIAASTLPMWQPELSPTLLSWRPATTGKGVKSSGLESSPAPLVRLPSKVTDFGSKLTNLNNVNVPFSIKDDFLLHDDRIYTHDYFLPQEQLPTSPPNRAVHLLPSQLRLSHPLTSTHMNGLENNVVVFGNSQGEVVPAGHESQVVHQEGLFPVRINNEGYTGKIAANVAKGDAPQDADFAVHSSDELISSSEESDEFRDDFDDA